MSDLLTYAIYAVKYATREARRAEHFYGGDPHDGPMAMDYFVWAAVSPEQTVVVDAGFTAAVAARRQRTHLRTPMDGLRLIGIDAARVRHVILTHLHYDHVGNLDGFPAATFSVQEAEMAFWTGRHAGRGVFRALVEPDDVLFLVRENFGRRVLYVRETAEIVPGITVHRVGGHAAGLQVVRVRTARGMIVLASDATHFFANIDEDRPFSIVHDVPEMYDAFDTVRALADSPAHIVPGHDPLVMARYPAAGPGLEGIAVRIA
ncbi:MAG: N-acyl homoserine lactonase family protein [Thermomicrobia bacterium]|nr:N-acyl homoserine lactonase family protein [Thermomicrobia bacterium]